MAYDDTRKPTNGFPTQLAAIVDLHEAGLPTNEIMQRIGCSRETIHAATYRHRKRTGQSVPRPANEISAREQMLWDEDQDRLRRAIAARARRGARQALKALSQ